MHRFFIIGLLGVVLVVAGVIWGWLQFSQDPPSAAAPASAAASIWALTRALVSNRLVRDDGPLSVLKSFLPEELLGIAHAVGLSAHPSFRWALRRGFPYRMALIGVRAG